MVAHPFNLLHHRQRQMDLWEFKASLALIPGHYSYIVRSYLKESNKAKLELSVKLLKLPRNYTDCPWPFPTRGKGDYKVTNYFLDILPSPMWRAPNDKNGE